MPLVAPATVTRFRSGYTAITSPTNPRSLPLITFTRSPLRMCNLAWLFLTDMVQITSGASEMMRMKRFSHSPSNRAEDPRAARFVGPQDHRGILIELDVRAIGPASSFAVRTTTALDDLPFLTFPPGMASLTVGDDVADPRVTATGSAEHADAQDLLGTSVVGDLEPRLLLDHLCSFSLDLSDGLSCRSLGISGKSVIAAFSTISTRRQRLVALSGRRSPSHVRGHQQWRCSLRRAP